MLHRNKVGNGSFYLESFLPKEMFSISSISPWWYLNRDLLKLCEYIQMLANRPLYINNWYDNGNLNYCGFRPAKYAVHTSSPLSFHSLNMAADIHGDKILNLWDMIYHNREGLHEKFGLGAIEHKSKTIKSINGWIHVDLRPVSEVLII